VTEFLVLYSGRQDVGCAFRSTVGVNLTENYTYLAFPELVCTGPVVELSNNQCSGQSIELKPDLIGSSPETYIL